MHDEATPQNPPRPSQPPPARKLTLAGLRPAARPARGGRKVAMLTCYDYSTARLMQQAGVQALLVGDTAAQVILGHPNTLPVPLEFMIEITAAVRRGAPGALVMADMPFGSYHGAAGRAVENVCRMVQRSGCDCIKLEVAPGHLRLVERLADAGVAVVAHLGLKPQSVGILGGYRFQGRTADEAARIVSTAQRMERAGAAGILLEAVPPEVAEAVVDATKVPVIGCGAGPACHAHVFVTHDAVGLTPPPHPRFVPELGDLATPAVAAYAEFVRQVGSGEYPSAGQQYEMDSAERDEFLRRCQARAAAGGI